MMIETIAMSSRSHQPTGGRRSRPVRYSDTAVSLSQRGSVQTSCRVPAAVTEDRPARDWPEPQLPCLQPSSPDSRKSGRPAVDGGPLGGVLELFEAGPRASGRHSCGRAAAARGAVAEGGHRPIEPARGNADRRARAPRPAPSVGTSSAPTATGRGAAVAARSSSVRAVSSDVARYRTRSPSSDSSQARPARGPLLRRRLEHDPVALESPGSQLRGRLRPALVATTSWPSWHRTDFRAARRVRPARRRLVGLENRRGRTRADRLRRS